MEVFKKKNSKRHLNKESGLIPLLIVLAIASIGIVGFFTNLLPNVIQIGLAIGGVLIYILGILAGFFFSLAVDISTWIMHLSMEIPITTGWAYDIGWTFTRDLGNMLFIIILAFIGLATVLRIKEYEVSKLLPKLLIIALLINFSPVLVGVIVDVFNILTNFFLQNISFAESFSSPLQTIQNYTGSLFSEFIGFNIDTNIMLSGFFGALASFVYFSLGIIVFLMIGLIYLFRVLAFWVLLILAPLAFASWILPATKKFWDMWWDQLIQWGMIGLTTAFFLYLSSHLLANADVLFQSQQFQTQLEGSATEGGGLPPGLAGILATILPYGVALVFMGIGIILGMQTGAMGAKQGISWSKKIGKGLALMGGKPLGTAVGRRISPKVEAWGKRLAQQGTALGEERGLVAKTLGGTIRLGQRWTGRGIATGAGILYRQVKTKDEEEIGAGKTEGTNKDSADNFRIINEELLKPEFMKNWNRIVGVLNATVANGDTDDIQEALRNGTLSGEAVGRALLTAQRAGPPAYRPIAKALYGRLLADPEQFGKEFSVRKAADGSIKRDKDGTPEFISDRARKIAKEIPEKLTSADITAKILGDTIDKGQAGGKEFVEFGGELVLRQLVEIRGGDLASALVRRPESREGRSEILNTFRKISPETLHELGADGLIRYLSSTAAQGAGVVSPLMPDETNDLLELLRDKDRLKTTGGSLPAKDAKKLDDLIKKWTIGAPTATSTPPPQPPSSTPLNEESVKQTMQEAIEQGIKKQERARKTAEKYKKKST